MYIQKNTTVICLKTVVGWSQKKKEKNLANPGFGLHYIISAVPQNITQLADTNRKCLGVSIWV
jgi:hypothetical protein